MLQKQRTLRWATAAMLVAGGFQAVIAYAAESRTNRDMYLEGGSDTAAVKPTVKFWAERERSDKSGNAGRDIVLGDEEAYRAGDKVWFKFSTNVDGYAYLVNKGTSGKTTMLFPGIGGTDNVITAHTEMILPTEDLPFTFDDQPGEEQLCLVIAPERIEGWDKMVQRAARESKPIDLTAEETANWQEVLKAVPEAGKTRDIVLQQENEPAGEEAPGNYATDHASTGFERPFVVYMNLKHVR